MKTFLPVTASGPRYDSGRSTFEDRLHREELGNEVPKEPLIFLKPPSALLPPGGTIVLPPVSKQVEFEGEIGVVIGKRARQVA